LSKTSINKSRNLKKIHITIVMDKVTLREVLLRVLVVIIIPPKHHIRVKSTNVDIPTEEWPNKLKIKDEWRLPLPVVSITLSYRMSAQFVYCSLKIARELVIERTVPTGDDGDDHHHHHHHRHHNHTNKITTTTQPALRQVYTLNQSEFFRECDPLLTSSSLSSNPSIFPSILESRNGRFPPDFPTKTSEPRLSPYDLCAHPIALFFISLHCLVTGP
jgi:hypothetical protein